MTTAQKMEKLLRIKDLEMSLYKEKEEIIDSLPPTDESVVLVRDYAGECKATLLYRQIHGDMSLTMARKKVLAL